MITENYWDDKNNAYLVRFPDAKKPLNECKTSPNLLFTHALSVELAARWRAALVFTQGILRNSYVKYNERLFRS